MCIYLYVKTHNKTGLKYLGKTSAKDPYKYPGSGLRWTNHLKAHGNDCTTEIIRECQDNHEVKEWGIYYSKLWNVVESDLWANLKEEAGDGGAYPNSGQHMKLPKYRAMVSENSHMRDDSHRQRMREHNPMDNLASRKKISQKLLGVPKSEEHKKNMYKPMRDPAVAARRKGKNNPSWDSTIYHFEQVLTGTTVVMDRHEFMSYANVTNTNVWNMTRGRTSKGWRLANL